MAVHDILELAWKQLRDDDARSALKGVFDLLRETGASVSSLLERGAYGEVALILDGTRATLTKIDSAWEQEIGCELFLHLLSHIKSSISNVAGAGGLLAWIHDFRLQYCKTARSLGVDPCTCCRDSPM
jgi:hypothetical protein